MEDLLLEISDTSVVLSGQGTDEACVSLPKREQTLDEVGHHFPRIDIHKIIALGTCARP